MRWPLRPAAHRPHTTLHRKPAPGKPALLPPSRRRTRRLRAAGDAIIDSLLIPRDS